MAVHSIESKQSLLKLVAFRCDLIECGEGLIEKEKARAHHAI